MFRTIKKVVNEYKLWKRIVWNEQTDYEVSPIIKLKYALKGFTVNEYVWFKLGHNDYKDYISELERMKSREINGKYKIILDDKLVFEEVFQKYVRVPRNYAWVNNGTIYPLHNEQIPNDNIVPFLHKVGKSILKWTDRGGGLGTYFFDAQQGEIWVNGENYSEDQITNIFKRNGSAILCEFIEQSDFSASLFPYATNTMRVVCAKKKGESNYEVIDAVQRIGCTASIPVDNAHNGGLACRIDLETGKLGYGIARLGKKENRMIPYTKHPDTGEEFYGKVIPDWEGIKNQMIDLTGKIPYLNFVAWDVLLTKDGLCIIEGNASTGCRIFQMESGIRDGKIADIYRSYNIIK